MYSFLTEKEKEKFNNTKIYNDISAFNSFSFEHFDQIPETIEEDFDLTFFSSALLLNNTIKIREVINSQNDSTLNNLFSELIIAKKQLELTYSLSLEERKSRNLDLDSLTEKTLNLERELVQKTSSFIDYPDYSLSKEGIAKALNKDEAAIQFNSFPYYNGKNWTDSTLYVAYILRSTGELAYIPLFEEEELSPLIKQLSENKGNAKELFGQLYSLVWIPLEEHLTGIKTIYYAPSGLLHKVSFNALVQTDSSYLASTHDLHALLSVRDIPNLKKTAKSSNDGLIALIGGANFEASTQEEIDESSLDYIMTKSIGSLLRSVDRSGWSYLKGSLNEVNQINKIASDTKQNTILKTGVDASEEQFNELVTNQQPQILHLATHGYYIPPPKEQNRSTFSFQNDNTFTNSDEPLLRSGILLAGANQKWVHNKNIDSDFDGILTALEVSRLDLSQTDLVVLSACETGLGDIKGSEGVYGIQRALKMAGVKNQLVSLWKVPDKETAEMMELFYTFLLNDKLDYSTAFKKAQNVMKEKNPNKPLKWAGFVLIE